MDLKTEIVPNKSSVKLGFCCCALARDNYFKYVMDNYLLRNVFPENKFNHLKGVNNNHIAL